MPAADLRSSGPYVAVLDSEALSALADPNERATTRRRALAVLRAVAERGGLALIPAPVFAETSRTARRRSTVERIARDMIVVDTDQRIATDAARLLERNRFGSERAVDAFVVATAARSGRARILTVDPDLERLAADIGHVGVTRIA